MLTISDQKKNEALQQLPKLLDRIATALERIEKQLEEIDKSIITQANIIDNK